MHKIEGTNTAQREALKLIVSRGGAVPVSKWATGSGRFTKMRSLPPFCERIERRDARHYPKRIRAVFEKNPRVSAVVAVTDLRAARRVLRKELETSPIRNLKVKLELSANDYVDQHGPVPTQVCHGCARRLDVADFPINSMTCYACR